MGFSSSVTLTLHSISATLVRKEGIRKEGVLTDVAIWTAFSSSSQLSMCLIER